MLFQRACVLLASGSFALIASADELAVYDGAGGLLPDASPCWIYQASAGMPAPYMDGDAVHLGPTTNAGSSLWRQSLVPFGFANGVSITAVVKVNSSSYYADGTFKRSGYYIALHDKFGKFAMLGISSDRILLATADQNSSDQTHSFNSTTGFNTYRLAFLGNTVTASINGSVVLTDTVGSGSGSPNSASFGDFSVLANSNTLTASVVVEGVPDCSQGDLNCDGIVDGADLGILLGAWGTDACAADLNHDLNVDGADLGILLGNWG